MIVQNRPRSLVKLKKLFGGLDLESFFEHWKAMNDACLSTHQKTQIVASLFKYLDDNKSQRSVETRPCVNWGDYTSNIHQGAVVQCFVLLEAFLGILTLVSGLNLVPSPPAIIIILIFFFLFRLFFNLEILLNVK